MSDTDGKFAESYRIGFKKGYNCGLEDAVKTLKLICFEQGIKITDSDFYLALEDLKNDIE
jgi:hypothetical protein